MQTTELKYHEKFTASELEAKASEIMELFHFKEVLDHMTSTDWKWCTRTGDMQVPDMAELQSTARYLLTKVIWDEKHVSHCGTGGFNAYKLPWGLKLEFVLVWS